MRYLFLFCLCFLQLFAFDLNYKSFASDFVQTVRSINSSISYEGSFVLTQNEAFWQYKKPNNKQIFIRKNEVIILEPSLEQATVSSLNELPNLSQIFKQAKKISKDHYEAKYQQIIYKIELQNEEIKSIAYKDELDNEVLILLANQKRNVAINKELFSPKIPPHYDLIR
ncbi:LolA-like outer membrane lipoprotein chaperone [Campylobacter troglodytis]|uniref:LolA-like outer membrane lipoprotein chaperone n=1 Tax=Campylobacter troglodytis TaxID=654363 RepID=UPI001156D060|nr:LolA-like outer membrane lipoprotein chaperone [Campylobacter troglodytis]TQR61084.1 outer membrane lipoprotein chaperone LolA [Campylobacter troglodytis]